MIPQGYIPAIVQQSTPAGRVIRLGPVVDEGVLLRYGDYAANTGPIDVIAVSDNKTVTVLLEAFDTEQITHYRVFDDGSVWAPSVDPRGFNVGSVATDRGGAWHTITVSVPETPVAAHIFDIAQDGTDIVVCGSRNPDVAFVWRSTNGGSTWTEDLIDDTDMGGFNRFFAFNRSGGEVAVAKGDSTGYYVRGSDSWSFSSSPELDVDEPVVRIDLTSHLIHPTRGNLGLLPTPAVLWTASEAPSGDIWLSDGEVIYLLPAPPD